MPFILQEPDQIVDVTLPFQKDVPEADRIKWKVRALSSRAALEYDREFARVFELDGDEKIAALHALIRRVASDWSNLVDRDGKPVAFGDDALMLFSTELKLRIASQIVEAAGWGDVRSKKLGSP